MSGERVRQNTATHLAERAFLLGVGLVGVGLTMLYVLFGSHERLSTSDFVNSVFVLAMMGVTGWYSVRTAALVEEARLSRYALQPHMKLGVENRSAKLETQSVSLQNVGQAWATDVHATITLHDGVSSTSLSIPLIPTLGPGDSLRIPIGRAGTVGKDARVDLDVSFRTSAGEQISATDRLPLGALLHEYELGSNTLSGGH